MPYEIEVGGKADAHLSALDSAIGASVERKIQWLAENAAGMVHRRRGGMPEDLAGLCKLRVGDYRIFYWVYPTTNTVINMAVLQSSGAE